MKSFFNNPIERLKSDAQRLSEFPKTLLKLQMQGALTELASLVYSIYRCEHEATFAGA